MKAIINPNKCLRCKRCFFAEVCPTKAIYKMELDSPVVEIALKNVQRKQSFLNELSENKGLIEEKVWMRFKPRKLALRDANN